MSSAQVPPASKSISTEISSFVHGIDAMQAAFPTQTLLTNGLQMACAKRIKEYLNYNNVPYDPSTSTYSLGFEHTMEVKRLLSHFQKASAATVIVPQSYFSALISQYDSFLGGLLRCLFHAQPGLLEGSERGLAYSQLCTFQNLEEAKNEIIEKEIESILRESHTQQFEIMQNRFSVKLKKDLPIWPVFVEVTERRNLFAHTNGKVSSQYLTVCDRHNVDYDNRPSPGDLLGVSPDYFRGAHACIFEVGIKLAHVLWRKILPNEMEWADQNLLMLGFDLIVAKHYELAIVLGTFAVQILKNWSSDDIKRRMVINLAQAYKWSGNEPLASQIIGSADWSSCDIDFKLALAVLKDDFKKAAELMRVANTAKKINESDYRDWPIFKEFIKSQPFIDTFRDIFGHDLEPIQASFTDTLFGPIRLVESKVAKVEVTLKQSNGNGKKAPPAS
jgi:hypothetical protein